MAALLAAISPVAGEQVIGATIYIAVLAVMELPTIAGWSVVVVTIVFAETASRTVPGWEPQDLLVALLVFSAVVGWGIGQLIDRNIELESARETISELAVVAERERVARDLHDILGHSLSVVAIKAELAGRLLESDSPQSYERARSEVGELEGLARQSLADVRRTVSRMRSVTLDGEIAAARTALSAAGIRADLPATTGSVPAERRELFAWALREGVTNVVRHSGAQKCVVTMTPTSLAVEDDGCFHAGSGAEPGPAAPGFGGDRSAHGGTGLRGVRERADAAGAALQLGRGRLGGLRMEVRVA